MNRGVTSSSELLLNLHQSVREMIEKLDPLGALSEDNLSSNQKSGYLVLVSAQAIIYATTAVGVPKKCLGINVETLPLISMWTPVIGVVFVSFCVSDASHSTR